MSPLKAYRTANKLTLAEVASTLGVTKATVFKYESRERLSAETALEIERKLGISKSKLRPDLWPLAAQGEHQ